MEGNKLQMNRPRAPPPSASSTNIKVERRIVEKNRRNQMKILYSKLNSLLPNQDSKELAPTLADQIDEAINYIKSMEKKLEKYKEKKEGLLGKKRSSTATAAANIAGPNSPQIKVREMGSALEVVLRSGLEEQFIFYEIIHIFHEERAEIISASYAVLGSSVFYTLHAEIEDIMYEFGATRITERLKRLVYGSTSDTESQPAASWDYDIYPAMPAP